MNRPTSVLAALSAGEKATVLDELLNARPDLRELAETHAARLIATGDRSAVADHVAGTLRGLEIEELNLPLRDHRPGCADRRAGRSGVGVVKVHRLAWSTER